MKHYIGIDPGKINIGMVLCYSDETSLTVLEAVRIPYKNDNTFISVIQKLIHTHSIQISNLIVVIERQPRSTSITANMRFIQGYLTGIGCKAFMRTAITHGLKIDNYKDRKQYSLELAVTRVSSCDIKNKHLLEQALQEDSRKHDIADSFNLVFNEFIKDTN